jgi:phosphoserine phosphatase
MPEPFPHILNVISPDADALAGPLRAVAAEHGAAAGEVAWLAPARAFDIAFLDRRAEVLVAAREAAAGIAADINVLPAANRRKRLLIADMESTIIDCELIDELADAAGCRDRVAAITERAMRGEIAFEPALRERVALLKGLPLDVLERVYRERVHLNPGARELVATMRAHGARTMLISGGFSFFTERVAKTCGFHRWRSNSLVIEGGKLTGEVVQPILGREAKLSALEHAVAELNIGFGDTIAVGDGANDLAMIEHSGLGVAWHAKPILAEAANAIIAHGDLTALLYLQGYRLDEIVN